MEAIEHLIEGPNVPHSSWAGGTSDHDNLALQAEELLERLCLWDFNHDCGIELELIRVSVGDDG